MKKRRAIVAVCITALLAGVLLLPFSIEPCRDSAFIDVHTGSRHGYREWLFGMRTSSWYQESALETYMRANHPADFSQRWVSYAGTGRNGYGMSVSFAHGRPGPIIHLKTETINEYCKSASDSEKRELYQVFSRADRDECKKTVDRIAEKVLAQHVPK